MPEDTTTTPQPETTPTTAVPGTEPPNVPQDDFVQRVETAVARSHTNHALAIIGVEIVHVLRDISVSLRIAVREREPSPTSDAAMRQRVSKRLEKPE